MRFCKKRKAISKMAIILIVIAVVIAAIAAALAAIFLGFWQPFGRIVGSGDLATAPAKEEDFIDFAIVEVGWGFEVEIIQSNSYSVIVTADDNLFDYIEVSKAGNRLTIGLKWGYSYQSVTLRARITMPELHELQFSGGTLGTVEGFSSSHEFVLGLSGGSHLSGDFTTSADAQFTLSGGSHLTGLDGAANDLTISGSGGSHLDLSDFAVHDATVNLGGGSHATVNLDGRLIGDVSGGSHLKYFGTPTEVDVNTSGGSTVEKIG